MRPKHSGQPKASVERVVKDIRRATRRHFSAEDKIRIVLDGLRGEDSTLFESNFNAEFSFYAVC
jgi:transposase